MDYPVSFFVFHSSLLAVKNVDLVIACDGFLYVMEMSVLFIAATFNTEVFFKQFLIRTAVLQVEHSWQQHVTDTSLFR